LRISLAYLLDGTREGQRTLALHPQIADRLRRALQREAVQDMGRTMALGAGHSAGHGVLRWTHNAAAESFFATLKNEMDYRQRFKTRGKARFAVAEYIEIFYNRQRLHSHLGYSTPAEALADYQASGLTTTTIRNCPRSLTRPRHTYKRQRVRGRSLNR
jgi:transposase InsO family protein